MIDDPTEKVARLRDELDRQAQRFEAATQQIDQLTAQDQTGSISVTVAPDGALRQVHVVAGWGQNLDADELGPAVQEALVAAAAVRAEQWGTALAQEDDERPAVRPMATPGQSLAGQLRALTADAAPAADTQILEAMLAMVREINASIDQVSAEVDQHLRAEYSARSSSGHVTATVTGAGAVTGIGFDQAWLTRAHHSNVGREITEALQAAYAAAGEHGTQHIVDASPLGRLQRLAQDPVALAQTTRLLG